MDDELCFFDSDVLYYGILCCTLGGSMGLANEFDIASPGWIFLGERSAYLDVPLRFIPNILSRLSLVFYC